MIKKTSFYKGQDILNENFIVRMNNYFNPYEYNFESNLKDSQNGDIVSQKSKNHTERKRPRK